MTSSGTTRSLACQVRTLQHHLVDTATDHLFGGAFHHLYPSLFPSPISGVGRSMGAKLGSLGVRSCGDLQQVSLQQLQKEFGPRTGQTLFRFCRGLDDRPVRSEKERKSVSAEMNYNIRFTQVRTRFGFQWLELV